MYEPKGVLPSVYDRSDAHLWQKHKAQIAKKLDLRTQTTFLSSNLAVLIFR